MTQPLHNLNELLPFFREYSLGGQQLREGLQHLFRLHDHLGLKVYHFVAGEFLPRAAGGLPRLVQQHLLVAHCLQDPRRLCHSVQALLSQCCGLRVFITVREQSTQLQLQLGQSTDKDNIFLAGGEEALHLLVEIDGVGKMFLGLEVVAALLVRYCPVVVADEEVVVVVLFVGAEGAVLSRPDASLQLL